jgi:hypothetical protein
MGIDYGIDSNPNFSIVFILWSLGVYSNPPLPSATYPNKQRKMNRLDAIRIVPFLFVSSALYRPITGLCRTTAAVWYHGILGCILCWNQTRPSGSFVLEESATLPPVIIGASSLCAGNEWLRMSDPSTGERH